MDLARGRMIAQAALRLAHLGHPLIPLHSVTDNGRCSCNKSCDSPGKHPRTLNGLKDASADPATVAAWWRRWSSANVGLATGSSADLVVVDLDGDEGIDAFEELQAAHGRLPATRWVITGGGGRHAYLRHPGGAVKTCASLLAPHVDVRGDGGYVVCPPSNHVSGRQYEWANGERAAPCPAWLVHLLRPVAPKPRLPASFPHFRHAPGDYGRAALAGEEARVRMAPVGTRNHTLNAASFSLGQLVGGGVLDVNETAGALLEAALAAGLSEAEATRTIESGLNAGQHQPRGRTA